MKETAEEMIARIMSAPIDKMEEWVFRYYWDNREPNRPALYVVLEGKEGGAIDVVQGRRELGWRGGKIMLDVFDRRRFEQDIYDDDLLTEAEAREAAKSIGLDIDVPKKEIFDGFTQCNGYEPNIVDDDIDALLARREKAREKVKKRGW